MALVLAVFMLPLTAFAAVDFDINGSDKNDGYYNVISKKDWDIAPGISESEIVLNNDNGTRRQVLYVMEADMNSEYTKVIGSYAEMNTSKYQTSTMDVQAAWVEENWDMNVVGAMNTCLSWYTGYPADQVGKPLGFLMVDGEVLWDGCEGFPTVLVINKDEDANGNARPSDIPKVEMVQIRSTADLDGWEEQVIPCSSGFIVKDGVNLNSANHSDAAPRSVVGIKPDGTVVIMLNDGRQAPFSTGMSMYELAEAMIGLGCSYAVNCDGGGSSTYLSERPGEGLQVNNSPSDGGLRPTTQGILFISTAPSDGTFVRASVEADAQYYTPNSTVQFTAKGADLAGGAAEIPEAAVWKLSNEEMGSIDQNGKFVSNGTVGAVAAQLVYENKVVGEYTINIVVPDSIRFSQSTLTVPNGETSTFSLAAMYGMIEVVSKPEDFNVTLSSEEMGVLNGYELTATNDPTVSGGSITAVLTHDPSVSATMEVVFGKASEVIYDFENGFGDDWYVEQVQKRKNWSKTEATSHYNIVVDGYAVDAETGMVHDGEGAAAVYSDNTYATLNWAGAAMYWNQETVTYENVSSIGAWIYIPEDAVSFAVRFCLIGVKDGVQTGIDAYPHNYGDSLYFEESGWHYCSVDVSEYDAIILNQAPAFSEVNNNNRYNGFRIELSCQLNGGSSGEYNWITTPGVKGINTFYIDNLTVDYSEACDDREAPVFGEVAYVEPVTSEEKYLNNQRQEATVTAYNQLGFGVEVEETERVNATGLDASSASAYIDGIEVECDFNGKVISVDSVELTKGVHTVKFTICDKAGNYASVIRKINVQSGEDAAVRVVPKSDTDLVFTGSQYWVDVVAENVEEIDEVTLTLDLNNVNYWLAEHIETLPGFDVSYTTDVAGENLLYLTISRTGDVYASGEAVLASIPVQTWEWKEEDYPGYYPPAGGDNDLNGNRMYDPYEIWQEYVTSNFDVIVNPLAGEVIFTDGAAEGFSGDVIQVDTEQKVGTWWSASAANKVHFEGKSSWHLHVAGTAQDKAATCTENGYTGRVFCEACACVTETKLGHACDSAEGCGSVLEWGTTIPATGHDWQFNAEGKLACVNNPEELFNGVYTDGKTYVDGVIAADGWNADNTSYYKDGVKLTGSHVIDKVVYTFDNKGIYQPSHIYNGFLESEEGMMYFYTNTNYEEAYTYVDDTAYYFADGIGFDGEYVINGETCLFEDGKYVSCSTAEIMDAGWMGEKVNYIIYADGSMILGGEGATYKYTSRALLPWQKLNTKVKSIVVGKDITKLDQFALADIYYADTITFEEGSKLEYIGAAAILSNYHITEIVLPDSVKTITQNAFKMCKNLEDVYLPYGISYINKLAFVNNQNVVMEKIHLHLYEGTYAENYAKQYNIPYSTLEFVDEIVASGECGEAATWTLYQSGKMIIEGSGRMDDYASQNDQPWAEYRMQIKTIEIGKDITHIGQYAFGFAHNVQSVTFEEGSKLETVGAVAFYYMLYTTDITLPESVTSVGNLAFAYCSRLENVYIPQDITYMHTKAFSNSKNVELNVAEGTYAEQFAVSNDIAYTTRSYVDGVVAEGTCGEEAFWVLYKSGMLVIDGSGRMDDYANQNEQPWAEHRMQIKKIFIGKDITHIGQYAFGFAHNVQAVTFEEGSKLETIGAVSFYYMMYAKYIDLPEAVTSIGNLAFAYGSRLETVVVPQDITYIHTKTFYNSKSVTLNVAEGTYAEDYAVSNGIAHTTRAYVDEIIDSGICGEAATWTLYKSGKMIIGGSGAMEDYASQNDQRWAEHRMKIKTIEIGKDITHVGQHAFSYAHNVQAVTFEEGSQLETIGAASFMYFLYTTEIDLPETVTNIGNLAFGYCKKLETVNIPEGATVHANAFKSTAVAQ